MLTEPSSFLSAAAFPSASLTVVARIVSWHFSLSRSFVFASWKLHLDLSKLPHYDTAELLLSTNVQTIANYKKYYSNASGGTCDGVLFLLKLKLFSSKYLDSAVQIENKSKIFKKSICSRKLKNRTSLQLTELFEMRNIGRKMALGILRPLVAPVLCLLAHSVMFPWI